MVDLLALMAAVECPLGKPGKGKGSAGFSLAVSVLTDFLLLRKGKRDNLHYVAIGSWSPGNK